MYCLRGRASQGCGIPFPRTCGTMMCHLASWSISRVHNAFLGCGKVAQQETSDLHYKECNGCNNLLFDTLLPWMTHFTTLRISCSTGFNFSLSIMISTVTGRNERILTNTSSEVQTSLQCSEILQIFQHLCSKLSVQDLCLPKYYCWGGI